MAAGCGWSSGQGERTNMTCVQPINRTSHRPWLPVIKCHEQSNSHRRHSDCRRRHTNNQTVALSPNPPVRSTARPHNLSTYNSCHRHHQTTVRHRCLVITAANIALTHTVNLLIVSPPSTCVCFFVCLFAARQGSLSSEARVREGEGRAG